jgi:hypothetical protein
MCVTSRSGVAAVAREFAIAMAIGNDMNIMAEEPAQVADLLVEEHRLAIRIFLCPKEQRMPALHADVFRMLIAFDEFLVCVVAEKARQRVPHVGERAVLVEIGRAASTAPLVPGFLEKPVIVDFVTPDGTPKLGHDTLLDVLTCEKTTEGGSGASWRFHHPTA